MSSTSTVELYVDPTSTMGLENTPYAQGIDFTAKDYCPKKLAGF